MINFFKLFILFIFTTSCATQSELTHLNQIFLQEKKFSSSMREVISHEIDRLDSEIELLHLHLNKVEREDALDISSLQNLTYFPFYIDPYNKDSCYQEVCGADGICFKSFVYCRE